MKMTKMFRGWIAAGASAVALFASVAQAGSTNVPGSACVATNGAYASQVVGGFGAVSNKSTTSTLQVSCPIPAFYPSDVDVEVSVTKNTSAQMSCAVLGRSWDNTSGALVSVSKSGTGWQSFFIGNAPTNWAFNSVRCDLPKAGGSAAGTRNVLNAYYYYIP